MDNSLVPTVTIVEEESATGGDRGSSCPIASRHAGFEGTYTVTRR